MKNWKLEIINGIVLIIKDFLDFIVIIKLIARMYIYLNVKIVVNFLE